MARTGPRCRADERWLRMNGGRSDCSDTKQKVMTWQFLNQCKNGNSGSSSQKGSKTVRSLYHFFNEVDNSDSSQREIEEVTCINLLKAMELEESDKEQDQIGVHEGLEEELMNSLEEWTHIK